MKSLKLDSSPNTEEIINSSIYLIGFNHEYEVLVPKCQSNKLKTTHQLNSKGLFHVT